MTNPTADCREFLGLNFNLLNRRQASAWVCSHAGSSSFAYVVTPNVDHVVQIEKASEPETTAAYASADLTLCDSRILASLASISQVALPVVTGSDLTRDLLEEDLPSGRIALVGGDSTLHHALSALYPRFAWRFHQPPMGVRRNPDARRAIIDFVESGHADVVLFAIGAPQSELTCAEIKHRGRSTGVALCVGASLEFLTGAKQRAPIALQRLKLEWLYRLLSEPGRLWRRYLLEGPNIVRIWLRWRRLRGSRLLAASGSNPFDDA
jgi:N-acetylglucosaminyldiphosphoundecaprenol N-acetyl-beta-D-mannosaminyltransferase